MDTLTCRSGPGVAGLASLARARADIGDDPGAAACLRDARHALGPGSTDDRVTAYVALAWAAHQLGQARLATVAYLAARLTDRFGPDWSHLGLVLAVLPFVAEVVALVIVAFQK